MVVHYHVVVSLVKPLALFRWPGHKEIGDCCFGMGHCDLFFSALIRSRQDGSGLSCSKTNLFMLVEIDRTPDFGPGGILIPKGLIFLGVQV